MTRKLFTVIAAALLTATTTTARHLTPTEALARLSGNNTAQRARSLALKMDKNPVFEVKAEINAAEPQLYVFNQQSGNGYMVVSANDIARPLLGYSDTSSFDPQNIPVNMQWWLEEYARQIDWATKNVVLPKFGVATAAAEDFAPIEPMVTTKWNQSAPFNDMAPMVNGKRSVTGCVATAMAQVLNHNKYPEKFNGTVSYNWTTGAQTITVNMDTVPINYNLMRDVYIVDNPGTAEERKAVAQLMYGCGVAVNMNFSPSESGASSLAAAQGAYNYMGCNQAAIVFASSFDDDDWDAYMYNHLKTIGPAVYCGASTTGGHCFVCDGYQGGGLFHINWGWGGMSDGYFFLQALDPKEQGIGGSTSGYRNNMQVIQGVNKPQPLADFIPSYLADGGIALDEEKCAKGDTIIMSGCDATDGFWSYTIGTFDVAFGINIYDPSTKKDNFAMWTWGGVTAEDYADDGLLYSDLPWNRGWRQIPVSIPTSIPDGHYYIKPAFKTYGGGWHNMPADQSSNTYVVLDVVGDSCYFTKPLPASILVDETEITTPFIAGQYFTIKGRVTSTDEARKFNGTIAMALGEYYNGKFISDYQSAAKTVKATPGQYTEFSLTGALNTKLKGEYDMVFINVASGSIVSEPVKVTVTKYPGKPVIEIKNFIIDNAENVNPANVHFSFDAEIVSGMLSSAITIEFQQILPQYNYTRAAFVTSQNYLSAGDSKSYDFKANLEGGKLYDGSYAVFMYYTDPVTGRNYLINETPFNFAVNTSGVENVQTDDNDLTISFNNQTNILTVLSAKQVEIYNLAGLKVADADGDGETTLDHLGSGVYIVKATNASGASKVQRIAK